MNNLTEVNPKGQAKKECKKDMRENLTEVGARGPKVKRPLREEQAAGRQYLRG